MTNVAIDALGLAGQVERPLSFPLAPFGQALMERVGPLNVGTALLFAGALGLDRLLARRARASWRMALYLPVALRILLPLDWSLRLESAAHVEMIFAPLIAATVGSSVAPASGESEPWYAIAAAIYLAVTTLLAARTIAARVRLEGALACATPVTDRRFGVGCPMLEHPFLGPMVVGLFTPRIVLPHDLLAPEKAHLLDCVLRHEAAHLRRFDTWLSTAMHVFTIVAWPVLPASFAARRVRHLMELACDERALAGCDAAARRHYGHALLDIAELRMIGGVSMGAGELHFGSTLRTRIEALASQRHWPLAAQALVASSLAFALFAACGGSASSTRGPAKAGAADDTPGYGYEFATDTAEKVSAAPASSLEWPPLNEHQRLPPEAIEAVVRGHFGATLTCYEIGRRANVALAGIVTVRFVIQEDGYVREAAGESSTLPDQDVVRCIVADFKKRHFPPSHDGDVTVVYPIKLGA